MLNNLEFAINDYLRNPTPENFEKTSEYSSFIIIRLGFLMGEAGRCRLEMSQIREKLKKTEENQREKAHLRTAFNQNCQCYRKFSREFSVLKTAYKKAVTDAKQKGINLLICLY